MPPYGLSSPGEMPGLPKSRPIALASNLGARPRPTARRPPGRPIQTQRGRPSAGPGMRRRSMPGKKGPAGGGDARRQLPLIDPMTHGRSLSPEVSDYETAAGYARVDGIGEKGTERGMLNVTRRKPGQPNRGRTPYA
jgi:hypothetical protein